MPQKQLSKQTLHAIVNWKRLPGQPHFSKPLSLKSHIILKKKNYLFLLHFKSLRIQHFIIYVGVQVWNRISNSIKNYSLQNSKSFTVNWCDFVQRGDFVHFFFKFVSSLFIAFFCVETYFFMVFCKLIHFAKVHIIILLDSWGMESKITTKI